MLILGLAGGPDPVDEDVFGIRRDMYHDAACALIEDGRVICAIEEERLNRVKHTNKYPREAILQCLRSSGFRFEDIDLVSYYGSRETVALLGQSAALRNKN